MIPRKEVISYTLQMKLIFYFNILAILFSNQALAILPTNIESYFNEKYLSCFLLKKIGDRKIHSYNPDNCNYKRNPYSTFKILNSLIALETGVIKGNKTVILWDKKKQPYKSWEKDHNIQTAIKYSVVPFYQEVARRIGKERMQKYINQVGYGNQKIGKVIDRFWLDGPIEILANEQLDFIEKLYINKLPFKKSNQQHVRDILVQSENEDSIFSGKTGSSFKDGQFQFGWFVGHYKKGKSEYVFVINSKGIGEAGHKLKKVAYRILQDMNL